MDEAIPLDGSFVPPVPSGEDIDLQKAAAAEKAYADAGLERAVHKSFRAQTLFKAWGAEIDGIQGVVGAPLLFRQQTWSLIQQVVLLGWCNKKILQKILGYVCLFFSFVGRCIVCNIIFTNTLMEWVNAGAVYPALFVMSCGPLLFTCPLLSGTCGKFSPLFF